SDLRESTIAMLRRAAVLAAKTTLQAFVVVHREVTSCGGAGIAKSIAREYPHALVKSIEIGADLPSEVTAKTVFKDLVGSDQTVEVGYVAGRRQTLALEETPIERRPLREKVVVAIAGGGRGLGAKLAIELACRHIACLLSLGRTAEPDAVLLAVPQAGAMVLYTSC